MNHLYFEDLRPTRSNPREGNRELQDIAARYCDIMGYPEPIPTPYIKVNEAEAKQIAVWFDKVPDQSDNSEVRRCYSVLINEVKIQWDLLIKEYSMKVEAFLDDFVPYKDSAEMMSDVRDNHHMWVYDGGEDHSLLTRRENFMFRMVHDAMGHCQNGYEFGQRGEKNAFQEHCKMFSPDARRALSAETNMQNSWVTAGPYSHLPVRERPFAEQKAVLVPWKWCTTPELQKAYADYPEFFPTVTVDNPRRDGKWRK